MFLSSALFLTSLAAAALPGEASIQQHIVERFEAVGRSAPIRDPALSKAARSLAAQALLSGAAKAAEAGNVSEAVWREGSWDPDPRALLFKSQSPEAVQSAVAGRKDLTELPATHMGIGFDSGPTGATAVILLSERRATLRPPLPGGRRGKSEKLCGALISPLRGPEVWVTVPSGTVQKAAVESKNGQTFCAPLALETAGRYMVEVIGKSQKGPEVAALLPVTVGEPSIVEREAEREDPASPDALPAALLARANALRKKFGSPPLEESRLLSRVAQAYSERMAKENFFAHIAPDGEDFTQRLDKADVGYERAGENLGAGPSALSAHAALERSPGHRKNLLDPDFTHMGIGYSKGASGSATGTLVELYARHPSTGFENADLYRTIAQKRAAAGRAPLEKSAALEAVAFEEAKRLARLGTTEVADGPMHRAIAAADKSIQSAKIELFVVGTPRALPSTEAMTGTGYNQIGAAAARRQSGPSGGKWWVVVIFATRPPR